jgi:hypothetical protein
MISCFAGGEIGEAMHLGDVVDEIGENVRGFWLEAPLLGFFAEMPITLEGGEDFVDDSGTMWCGAVRCGAVRCGAVRCGAVLGSKCDDAVDCCPIPFSIGLPGL